MGCIVAVVVFKALSIRNAKTPRAPFPLILNVEDGFLRQLTSSIGTGDQGQDQTSLHISNL